jgi:hypothetical protein
MEPDGREMVCKVPLEQAHQIFQVFQELENAGFSSACERAGAQSGA